MPLLKRALGLPDDERISATKTRAFPPWGLARARNFIRPCVFHNWRSRIHIMTRPCCGKPHIPRLWPPDANYDSSSASATSLVGAHCLGLWFHRIYKNVGGQKSATFENTRILHLPRPVITLPTYPAHLIALSDAAKEALVAMVYPREEAESKASVYFLLVKHMLHRREEAAAPYQYWSCVDYHTTDAKLGALCFLKSLGPSVFSDSQVESILKNTQRNIYGPLSSDKSLVHCVDHVNVNYFIMTQSGRFPDMNSKS